MCVGFWKLKGHAQYHKASHKATPPNPSKYCHSRKRSIQIYEPMEDMLIQLPQMFSNLVCKYFVETFCICVHQGN